MRLAQLRWVGVCMNVGYFWDNNDENDVDENTRAHTCRLCFRFGTNIKNKSM